MSLASAINYHLRTEVMGRAFLRYQRLRFEWKAGKPYPKQNPALSPMLKCVPRLKELISTHYLHGRYADTHKKVAWVTSGAPAEILKALGFFTYYPENHGAVCGVRRMAADLSSEAENLGYSRDLCSYARTDIGSFITGKTPVGHVPRPDMLMCCTNICQTVLYWYQVVAHHFKVPLVIIDTPFVYDKVTNHTVDFVTKQLEKAVETAERISGKTLTDRKAREVGKLSKEAMFLWNEILSACKNRPSPISAFDQFFFMAPIVDMRGESMAVDFYWRMLKEVRQRVRDGIGSITYERKRLIWDNLPIWHNVRHMAEMLAERGHCIVASTYTNAWAELAHLFDSDALVDSTARLCLQVILNRSVQHKLNTITTMVEEYCADGIILHSDRSCKPYSIGQIDQREKLIRETNTPAMLLEADHNDPRSFSREQMDNRLSAFMEIVESV